MMLPFLAAASSFDHLPSTLSFILILVATSNALFDLYHSPRAGDLSRASSFYGPS
jgi:hypothetical protein